jgi:curli biogenesis system outer membrane secretion channel CsgG
MSHKTPYQPPEQSAAGQLFDSLFVIVLVAATLLGCLYLTVLSAAPAPAAAPAAVEAAAAPTDPAAPAAEAPAAKAAEPSAQDKIKAERFAALGWDAARVAEREAAIAAKSYSIDWSMLLLTALVVIGYFSFLVRASDKELREVIAERFGPASTPHPKETP